MKSDDIKEMFAGSAGGALATVVEYPLDTIKVRLQEDPSRYRSSFACIREIVKQEGTMGLFRGLPAPVLAAAMENAALFCSYRAAIGVVQDFLYKKRFEHDAEPYLSVFLAAAVGGIIVSHALTPAELIKCKMQVQNTLPDHQRIYRNSLQCVFSIYRTSGVRGLYRGHISMILREIIGCGLYFLTFQWVIRNMLHEGQQFKDASPLVHFLGGGCAGVAFWASIYPIDSLKTKIQTGKTEYVNLSFSKGMSRLYKNEGIRGFMRGFNVTAARAFPGNAVLIAVYEQVNALWDMKFHSYSTLVRSTL